MSRASGVPAGFVTVAEEDDSSSLSGGETGAGEADGGGQIGGFAIDLGEDAAEIAATGGGGIDGRVAGEGDDATDIIRTECFQRGVDKFFGG